MILVDLEHTSEDMIDALAARIEELEQRLADVQEWLEELVCDTIERIA